jgi:hypothetical protein
LVNDIPERVKKLNERDPCHGDLKRSEASSVVIIENLRLVTVLVLKWLRL